MIDVRLGAYTIETLVSIEDALDAPVIEVYNSPTSRPTSLNQ